MLLLHTQQEAVNCLQRKGGLWLKITHL